MRFDVPAALDAIVLRGLDRVQEQRFASARDMALELEKSFQMATAAEIGSWVQSIADHSLSERRQKLAHLERESAREFPADSAESGPSVISSGGAYQDGSSTVVDGHGRPRANFITRVWFRARGLFNPPR